MLTIGLWLALLSTFLCVTDGADWDYFQKNHKDISPVVGIIGGDEAVPHAYPYQVGLLIDGDAFCGGALISSNYVLTAAHCATAIYNNVVVILGAHNIKQNESTQVQIKGSDIIVHEQYNYTSYQNDIALIKLSEPVTLNDVIKTIGLAPRNDVNNSYFAEEVTSTGWGLTEDGDLILDNMSPVLMVVNLSVITWDECDEYYNDYDRNVMYVTDNNICTSGYKNKGTCNGDSGGPLVLNDAVIGLVSIGSSLCEMCTPSIFTKVAKYLDWIQTNSDVVIP